MAAYAQGRLNAVVDPHREFDNYYALSVSTAPSCRLVIGVMGISRSGSRTFRSARELSGFRQALRRYPAPVDRKSDAVDEAGIITGEEDDRRSKFLGLSYATCWC